MFAFLHTTTSHVAPTIRPLLTPQNFFGDSHYGSGRGDTPRGGGGSDAPLDGGGGGGGGGDAPRAGGTAGGAAGREAPPRNGEATGGPGSQAVGGDAPRGGDGGGGAAIGEPGGGELESTREASDPERMGTDAVSGPESSSARFEVSASSHLLYRCDINYFNGMDCDIH
jgi:hypothetical protein